MGTAWYEDEVFTFDRKQMTPRHLVVLIANGIADRDDSSPQPRLWCPPVFVGTWRQLEPKVELAEPISWHLDADGTFGSNDPARSESRYWCATRGFPEFHLQLVHARNARASGLSLNNAEVTGDKLTGRAFGRTSYELRRVSVDRG